MERRPEGWLLLIHQVPSRPAYVRARVRAELARAGAVAVKNSVYALPASEAAAAALEAIARGVRRAHGQAVVCAARFMSAGDHRELVAAFRRERSGDYARLRDEAASAAPDAENVPGSAGRPPVPPHVRLVRRLESLRAVDFFDAPGSAAAERAVRRLAAGARRSARGPDAAPAPVTDPWRGHTWVTRAGVHVDRIACAWFILRFLDAEATFRFVSTPAPALHPREVAFDIPGVGISHEAGGCSFETLLARTGVRDPALERIAGIVHDLDLGDERFAHPETAGVRQLLAGVVAAHAADSARIEHGAELLDHLYRSLSPAPAPRRGLPGGKRES